MALSPGLAKRHLPRRSTPTRLRNCWPHGRRSLSRETELLEPETTARLILHFLHKEKTAADFATLAPALAKAASRLELATAAPLCEEALGLVTDIAAHESSFESRAAVAASIGAITKRMPRGAAARALTEALGRPRNALDRQRLAAGLGAGITAMAADARCRVFARFRPRTRRGVVPRGRVRGAARPGVRAWRSWRSHGEHPIRSR